jgi:hypothetical protein
MVILIPHPLDWNLLVDRVETLLLATRRKRGPEVVDFRLGQLGIELEPWKVGGHL